MEPNRRLAWGIIATGRIARTFANSFVASKTGKLVAVASRTQEAANDFAKDFPGVRAHGSYEALLTDPDVQAVYISTPHPMHIEWVIRAARAGKHILCEKPIGLNHSEAMAAAEAARNNGVFLMEAFMYRCHPQTAKIAEIVRSGRLGKVRMIAATFGFDAGAFNPKSRLFAQETGGGAILDVGCYCMSMARLIAGAAAGKPLAEPERIKGIGTLAENGVDVFAQALLTFSGGLQARLATAITFPLGSSVVVTGSEATLRVPEPWFCGHPVAKLEIETKGKIETIEVPSPAPLYALEMDTVALHVAEGEAPCLPIGDTVGNMAALDAWRKEVGVVYEVERLKAPRPRMQPLRKVGAKPIPNLYKAIPGLDPKKRASRMVLGAMLDGTSTEVAHGFALFDYFLEHGGNIYDTSYHYFGGASDRVLGDWIKQRGVRDETIIIAKGAHTPTCDPLNLRSQFHQSLEWLQTDYADIYMLHRDNPAIPVGEFVDVLNEEVKAGRIGIFGGSNWSLARVDEANAYAKRKGLQGFGAVSNQFSLARMVNPPWTGCIASSDAESRRWLAASGIPLFAWSSQARGFFTRAARDFHGDPELEHCWYSDDNFERLRRVQELAREKHTGPIHIAAAYVLHQDFTVFPLIGPRQLSELSSSLQAFDVSLTPTEVAWLNLESESRS
jgi:predicted dehydrogenase/aryl-alcohol dehydrogenase-like predicted oxidoreductase